MISITPKNNINFTSRYVMDVPISKRAADDKYEPYTAKLVEFDINDEKDDQKIDEICKKDEFYSFGFDLYNDLHSNYFGLNEKKYCYALVENSEKDLTNIDKDKILGIYSLYEKPNSDEPLTLAYFMTNADYKNEYKYENPKFKNVGRGMFQSIPKMYPNKSIFGFSAWSAMSFWEKMGFEHLSERRLIYKPAGKEITDR
ncbi:hypothetical protein IJI31_05080 [bacterium]|nr:hypothetical protein [bacterium]